MRHRKAGRKLNINSSHRKAMFRNMVTSLFKHDRIRTTDTRAKELRSLADRLVTLAKRGDLHARRQVLSIVREKDVVHKLFEEAGERFGTLSGGYTRIVKIGRRAGDAAPMSIIELVTPSGEARKGKKKKAALAPEPQTPAPVAAEPEDAAPAAFPVDERLAEAPEAETSPDAEAAAGVEAADGAPESEAAEAGTPAEGEKIEKDEAGK